MFTKAIVRRPSQSLIQGITTADLGLPDFSLALKQHDAYIEALQTCGLAVTILEANEEYPDSVFVEDTAVVTGNIATLSNPGPTSRKGELAAIEPDIRSAFETVYQIESPGTFEGGDVLQVEQNFYVGLSDRTNLAGFKQFSEFMKNHSFTCLAIDMKDILHLKTGLSFLGDNSLLLVEAFENEPNFSSYRRIVVDEKEAYAANCIRVNDYVLLPSGYSRVSANLKTEGFNVIELDMSEFQKLDGGLSCLSLRF